MSRLPLAGPIINNSKKVSPLLTDTEIDSLLRDDPHFGFIGY